MPIEVVMPQMGESVVEGTVAKWLVKEGDTVAEDQALCEVSTDKVDTEIPSPAAGRIATLLVAEGETVPVGARLAVIEATGAQPQPSVVESKPVAPAAQQAPQPQPSRPEKPREISPAPRAAAPPAVAPAAPETVKARMVPHRIERPPGEAPRRYSPVVLRMAAEHGIDLARVRGTGIDGRISKRDLERFLAGGVKAAAPAAGVAPSAPIAPPAAVVRPPSGAAWRPVPYQPREGDTVEPFSRRRKLIAEHMVFSKSHSPHVGTVAEVDMTAIMRLRAQHKDAFQERESFGLTVLPLIAAATVRALKEFPRMNASVVGDSIVIRKEINLGIAMDTPEGLLVPVIRRAEEKTVVGIAREIEALRRKVAEHRMTADDLAGGSFTLSNPGREGNLYGFAIINQPQVGILRMGEIKQRPIVVQANGENAIAIRAMMYLALSYDHRAIDGVLGNSFLYRVARLIEQADFEL
jgi:pyruvate/2-oxoglutarate dehydrogenase complex dihydrolipoamide acyltransferase (E2) component